MKELVLKKVSLMIVSKKQKVGEKPIIGFMRFNFDELGEEHVEEINGILQKCPESEYTYSFYALDDNAIYSKNENNELVKKERSKESILGKGRYIINAEMNEHQSLKVKVSFRKENNN